MIQIRLELVKAFFQLRHTRLRVAHGLATRRVTWRRVGMVRRWRTGAVTCGSKGSRRRSGSWTATHFAALASAELSLIWQRTALSGATVIADARTRRVSIRAPERWLYGDWMFLRHNGGHNRRDDTLRAKSVERRSRYVDYDAQLGPVAGGTTGGGLARQPAALRVITGCCTNCLVVTRTATRAGRFTR